MAHQLELLGCTPDKIRVHHLGVDVKRIEFIPRTLRSGEPVRLLLAASFTEKKGIPYAIEAFAKALEKHPNMELRIIGDASNNTKQQGLLRYCQRLVMEAKISDKVFFLGYLPYPDYVRELQSAHLFLAPSVTAADGDVEGGAPVAIIEASAAGLPIISTWHCDIPSVVLHERSGLLVKERDIEQLAAAISHLAASPQQWTKMGHVGRRHVELEYSASRQSERLEELYAQLIGYGSIE